MRRRVDAALFSIQRSASAMSDMLARSTGPGAEGRGRCLLACTFLVVG
jgi:hypothetical protein